MRKKEQLAANGRPPPEQLALDFDGPGPAGPLFRRDELPRDPAERGHHAFESERDEAIRALQERFGLILNRRVRVRLAGWDEDLVGKLVLAQLLLPASRKEELRLRLGDVTFEARDIERCILVRDGRLQS